MKEHREELTEKIKFGEKIESTAGIDEVQEEKEKDKVEMKSQEELEVMLKTIQKWIIYEQWHFEEEELYYMPNYREDDRVYLKAEDLEEVIFYQDAAGIIYFIPTSMVNKSITTVNGEIQIREYEVEGESGYYLYCYEYYRKEWRRPIYPEPDNEYIRISCTGDMKDKMEEIYPIGVAKVPFPQNIPQEAFESKLYENEYTDAVVEIIHSWLFRMKEYGEYKI